jgi:protein-S-isoprenylcysteine O-methyltransferase Ste14
VNYETVLLGLAQSNFEFAIEIGSQVCSCVTLPVGGAVSPRWIAGWRRKNRFVIWLTLFSQAPELCAYFPIFLVLKANSFASGIVRVEKEQEAISSGPYRLVRHPMHSAILILVLFTPTALGSYLALPVFALIPHLIFRLLNEEKILRNELYGFVSEQPPAARLRSKRACAQALTIIYMRPPRPGVE